MGFLSDAIKGGLYSGFWVKGEQVCELISVTRAEFGETKFRQILLTAYENVILKC